MLARYKRYSEHARPLSDFSDVQIAEALRAVINHTITHVFDLTQAEARLVNDRLQNATAHLFVGKPKSVPVQVLQELNTHYYSHSLLNKRGGRFQVSPTPQKADLLAYVDIFMEMCMSAYKIPAMQQAHLHLDFMNLMDDIGVRDNNSRSAEYLPNAVKNNLPA